MKKVLSRKAAVTQGALMAFLAPKLAADARLPLTPYLEGLTFKNFKAKIPSMVASITKDLEGKLAKDADISDLADLLNALEGEKVPEGPDTDANSGLPMEKEAMDDDKMGKIMEFLKTKLSPEDHAQCQKMLGNDEPPPFKGRPEPGKGATAMDDEDEEDMGVTPAAMDAAITKTATETEKRTIARMNAIREAERVCRPYVGDLDMAFDSAESVYQHTLKTIGVDVEGIHSSAFKALLKTQPVPGAKPAAARTTPLAMDSASTKTYNDMFPGADAIRAH